MRRLLSAAHHPGAEVGLPAEVEQLLVEVVTDGFVVYCCGPKAAPMRWSPAISGTTAWICSPSGTSIGSPPPECRHRAAGWTSSRPRP